MSSQQPHASKRWRHGSTVRHVALIADGHRRWARTRGLSIQSGYDAGIEVAKARVLDALSFGVNEITIFTFSTDNWRRSTNDVNALMDTAERRIRDDTPGIAARDIRIRFIGRREGLPDSLAQGMTWAEAETTHNRGMTLSIAINYGGRTELLDAARRFTGTDEAQFASLLYAPDMADPDVLIRTGGDKRLSNFMLWQSAYTELVFRDELFPEFTRTAFEESLSELGRRQRRFGGRQ